MTRSDDAPSLADASPTFISWIAELNHRSKESVLRFSSKKLGALLGVVVSTVALSAVGAGAAGVASAAVFNQTGTVAWTLSGPLTLTYTANPMPTTTITCPAAGVSLSQSTATNSGGQGSLDGLVAMAGCTRGVSEPVSVILALRGPLSGVATGGGFALSSSTQAAQVLVGVGGLIAIGSSPVVVPYSGVWTNGTSSFSTLDFDDTTIAYTGQGAPMKLTARFVPSVSGGTLTLN